MRVGKNCREAGAVSVSLQAHGSSDTTEDMEYTTMLVLSRKSGERILIGDDVAITVVRIGPNSVRIGIEAPKSMNIVREELCNFDDKKSGSTSEPEALPL